MQLQKAPILVIVQKQQNEKWCRTRNDLVGRQKSTDKTRVVRTRLKIKLYNPETPEFLILRVH